MSLREELKKRFDTYAKADDHEDRIYIISRILGLLINAEKYKDQHKLLANKGFVNVLCKKLREFSEIKNKDSVILARRYRISEMVSELKQKIPYSKF